MQKVKVYNDTAGETARSTDMDEMQKQGWTITAVEYRTITLTIVVYDTDKKGE